ncbi:ChrR family anti-sigma-E factor [Algirhabdus cladophorae]|uniref:ChrR family anti-sigma-E factor n=1 Tax=Algirhabdus cladophorae TaxID=3377108 RepID=UPI003B84947C
MKQIRHHLTDDLLMAYASGNLPEALSLVVATHISMCDSCRAQLASFDAVGGELLDDLEAVTMSDGALGATLKQIMDAPAETTIQRPKADSLFPAPLQDYVGADLDAIKWRPMGMGVRQSLIKTSKGASVRLLHIPAGCAVPDHGHHGTELTLVLQGAFRDHNDRFGPGDIEVANEDLHHTPVAEDGVDCICLAASDAPLSFNGILPKIAQRFMGI